MFSALTYHSTDYLYESIARQKFSIRRFSLCFPPSLHQNGKNHLNGLFADDKYRKPWTRIASIQNTVAISVLDQWKKSLSVEDFLEKKPVSSEELCTSNKLVEFIPSSNPCSQTEDIFALTKNVVEEESIQDKYLKIDYATEFKEQWQDLYMEDKLVFIDNLETFRKKMPTSSILLSRLHIFLVKDPLLDSRGQNLTGERECLTFQNEMEMDESKAELQGIEENFCTIPIKDEEYFMLPLELECCKRRNARSDSVKVPSYLELKEVLNLAPETMADEDMCKEVIKEDLKAEIACKIDISKYCAKPQDITSSDSRSMLEFCESAKYVPYLKGEMEVPLTPPCRQQRSWVNSVCTGLQEEPISLSGNSILITESSREYLEYLVWQSEKYQDNMNSLLLVEHKTVKLAYQRHSLTELKKMLRVELEEPMLSSLDGGWWLHLGFNPVSIESLEQLNTDDSNANSLVPAEIETFTQVPSDQLERYLEEKNSVTNQDMLYSESHQSDKVIDRNMSQQTQWQHFALHTSTASSAKIHSADASVEQLTVGSIKKNETEEAIYLSNQENKPPKSPESVSCKDMSSKEDSCKVATKEGNSTCHKPASFELATKLNKDDSDLSNFVMLRDDSDLSNFIMLRSTHKLTPRQEKKHVDCSEKVPEEQHTHCDKEDSSVCETVRTEEKEQKNEDSVTVDIQASESQCQAYCLLEEAATPVLKELTHLGVLASVNWHFDSIKFDHTRFFLKQQEKVVGDLFEEGKIDEKEIMLFRHAALVHLLVTVRDLLLTCGLDTALGYLSKAKDIYKTILESCLNNIWRQLKIVQCTSQKKHETSPKITELQCQILNWKQSYGGEHSAKVLIITRMDSEREKTALIHTLSTVGGLKVVDLNSEKKGNSLGCKDIMSSLGRYSCVIVHNQQIGAGFPWTHFSLVMEYDYSENSCWRNLCKNLNVTYMTFKTTIPKTMQMGNDCGSCLLEVQIPYVFLTTEGLINMADILQLLESKYSITFIERFSNYSLRLFGSTNRYVVLTVDECTAIFLQSMEELNYEISCDNVITKLMALSLQYTCCWIVFYSKERLNLEYCLKGDILHNLVLIYATLTELTQKSEDFEVKVVLTPGTEETALVIRQIADSILIASDVSPQEWLDKSWISVLPSETEKCLLTFPCINPLVAQLMLKKASSLNKLFLASFDQLQELLPEVPRKVLKHFSDITSLHSLNAAAPLETAVKDAPVPENQHNLNAFYADYKRDHQPSELLGVAQSSLTGTPHMNSEAVIPPVNHHQSLFDTHLPSYLQKKSCSSEVIIRSKQNSSTLPKDCEDLTHLDVTNSLCVQKQPFRMHYTSDHSSTHIAKGDFFAISGNYQPQECSKSFLEEFRETTYKSPEILMDQTPWNDSSSTGPCDSSASDGFLSDFFVDPAEHRSLNFHQTDRKSKEKRKQSPPFLWTKGKNRTDSGFAEIPEFKKKKLAYERVPGRSDGQTRLKFF